MEIRRYAPADADALMAMIEAEGEAWSCYTAPDVAAAYRRLLAESITNVATEDGQLCGYSRSLPDGEFYIYVCDLLVTPAWRGCDLGRHLMECLYAEYPNHVVYVMSDVDGYYKKLGYRKEGSVFEVDNPATRGRGGNKRLRHP